MYIEKNGYLVANPKDLSFLTDDREFSDDIELAEIFSTNTSALEAIDQFVEGYNRYIVLRYNNTIWIDQDAEQPKTPEKECCSGEDCCCECKNPTTEYINARDEMMKGCY